MRRIAFLIIIFICALQPSGAQINYLNNPSFENKWGCPFGYDQIKLAKFWSSINDTAYIPGDTVAITTALCSPEFCHTCSSYINSTVPDNSHFNHYPRTGNGVAQVYVYYNEFDSTLFYKRDYLQGRLKRALQSGVQYCVTFYVCLEGASGYAINHIGAYFDDGTIDTTNNCGLPQTDHIPQIVETSTISDEVSWTKIQGIVTGTGMEKFITIGNFYDATHTDTVHVSSTIPGSYATWYLVDDISIIEIDSVADAGHDTTILAGDTAWIGNHDDYLPCKWYLAATGALIDSNHAGLAVHPSMTTSYAMELDVCGTLSYDTVTVTIHPTGINMQGIRNVKTYPNPVKEELFVDGLLQSTTYQLLNTLGVNVRQGVLQNGGNSIPLSQFPAGIYILELTSADGMRTSTRIVKE